MPAEQLLTNLMFQEVPGCLAGGPQGGRVRPGQQGRVLGQAELAEEMLEVVAPGSLSSHHSSHHSSAHQLSQGIFSGSVVKVHVCVFLEIL